MENRKRCPLLYEGDDAGAAVVRKERSVIIIIIVGCKKGIPERRVHHHMATLALCFTAAPPIHSSGDECVWVENELAGDGRHFRASSDSVASAKPSIPSSSFSIGHLRKRLPT